MVKMIELTPVQDTYIDGIGSVDQIARGVFRFTFYSIQNDPFTGGTQRVVVAKNICALENVVPALVVCADAIGWQLTGEVQAMKRFMQQH
ncbi:hypothetical protein [Nitratireductor sp. CH_MIT9313-5]|uniref:hypothetical protein n=1 Tax=Nitratireductor sp. CH_MIT9313-5 TaxID=3107764 RepID=UPI00300A798D